LRKQLLVLVDSCGELGRPVLQADDLVAVVREIRRIERILDSLLLTFPKFQACLKNFDLSLRIPALETQLLSELFGRNFY